MPETNPAEVRSMADHETEPDSPDECRWDLRILRDRVAGLGKSLIQARLATEPDFLSATEMGRWGLSGAAARPSLSAVPGYLLRAVSDLRWLHRHEFLPEYWQSSKVPLLGPDCVDRLSDLVVQLVTVADVDDPLAAFEAAVRRPTGPGDWPARFDWTALPAIRTVLTEEFPDVPRRGPTRRLRWDRVQGKLLEGDQVVREVAAQAYRIIKLLDAFEGAEWAETIPSPFGSDSKMLDETLDLLNNRLKRFRFSSGAKGQYVCWAREA
jgi:hypothetical protein